MSESETVDESTTDSTDALPMKFEKFWTNDLIWDQITSFLRVSDLKALSLVNKQLLDKVRRIPRLVFKQILKEELAVYVPVLDQAVVEVNSVDEYHLERFGADVFENVTHLELQKLGDMPNRSKIPILKGIISNCKMLTSLTFGSINFFKNCNQDLLEDEKVKQILSQLDELRIVIKNDNYEDMETKAFGHFKLLADLNLKLKKCTFHEPKENSKNKLFNSLFYPELILGSSLNFLVDIDLRLYITGLERLSAVNIPNLTSLKLTFFGDKARGGLSPGYNQYFNDNLIPFVERHLETLQIFALNSESDYSLIPICNTLKKSKKIRSLSLKCDRRFFETVINWEFLQTLSTLRSFELRAFEDEDKKKYPLAIVESVVLQLMRIPEMWMPSLLALPSTVNSIRMSGLEMGKSLQPFQATETLKRFQNLTELSMLDCKGFLSNVTLQTICSHLTKLRILKADFDLITDYGLTGTGCDPFFGVVPGTSIKNLKGLNVLVISASNDCLKITWNGLLNSVKFLELYHLSINGYLRDMQRDMPDFDDVRIRNYAKLIRQNPSLETCDLKFYNPGPWFSQELCRLSRRLKL